VWAAFAGQAQWKSWVLLGQFIVIGLLALCCIRIARTDPDVVVIDASGKSHYVPHSVASDALLRFLAEQKSKPSDATVLNFTTRFLKLFLAPNSSTVRSAVPEALGMMDAPLKARTDAELKRERTVEQVEALQVRTELSVTALDEVERTEELIHLKARLTRSTSSLVDGSNPKVDALEVDLVERVVPRSPARPDGLEIAEVRVGPMRGGGAQGAGGSPASTAPGSTR